MAVPHITLTLGRSGHDSDGSRANASVPSGSKRSLVESFGNDSAHPFSNSKRIREDVSVSSYGYNRHIDDLRLKLTHKRISRQIELENEECQKDGTHEMVSRAMPSLVSPEPDGNLLRSMPSRGAAETLDVGSMRSVYTSLTSDAERKISPLKSSAGTSTPRTAIGALPHLPSMWPTGVLRTERVLMSDPLDSFRPKVPMLDTSKCPLDSGNVVAGLPWATGGMFRPLYQDNQPLTVSSLLYSLCLGKYAIYFGAEEGPRKKILLALEARTKRQ